MDNVPEGLRSLPLRGGWGEAEVVLALEVRLAQHGVGLVDGREPRVDGRLGALARNGLLGQDVRVQLRVRIRHEIHMIRVRKERYAYLFGDSEVGGLDVLGRGVARYAQDLVVVLEGLGGK